MAYIKNLFVSIKFNNKIRNKIKDFYYKHLFYDFPVNWNKDYAEGNFRGQNIKMHYFQNQNLNFFDSKYFMGFVTLTKKLFGYLKYYHLKKGDIIIDAGAYEGEFTILASKIVGDNGKVISIEPTKQGYMRLNKNIRLNALQNVIPLNMALWNKNKKLKMTKESGASSISESGVEEVIGTTIDNILQKIGINKIDFLKADIEGAEIEMLKGAEKTLKKGNIKNMAIASYHIVNGERTYKKIEQILRKFDYKIKKGFPTHLTTYAKKDTPKLNQYIKKFGELRI